MSSVNDGKSKSEIELNDERTIGPYVLRDVLPQNDLFEEGLSTGTHITCVEFWDGNLYVGTSAAEIRHYVRIPASQDFLNEQEDFTYATTLQVPYLEHSEWDSHILGIQQILILPEAGKICILCNGSINFYSLPELSPVFTSTTGKLFNCTWVGGADLNINESGDTRDGSKAIMICQKSRIRLVSIGSRVQHIRDIELGACLEAVRRSDIACVADAQSYSLLDVVEQQRRDLFDISSIDSFETRKSRSSTGSSSRQITDEAFGSRNITSQSPNRAQEKDGSIEGAISGMEHARSTLSSGGTASTVPGSTSALSEPERPISSRSSTIGSPIREERDVNPRDQAITPSNQQLSIQAAQSMRSRLRPHIISPTKHEFLLTTGTNYDEPAVGMFVNMEGEVTRAGTIEFSVYPEALCSDSDSQYYDLPQSPDHASEEGYVLALVSRKGKDSSVKAIEIRRWGVDLTFSSDGVDWVQLTQEDQELSTDARSYAKAGLREVASACEVTFGEVTRLLQLSRLRAPTLDHRDDVLDGTTGTQSLREQNPNEAKFIARLAVFKARLLTWTYNRLYWVTRNPAILILDNSLTRAMSSWQRNSQGSIGRINQGLIEKTLKELRGNEPANELEFYTLSYIRQKGSIILFAALLERTLTGETMSEKDSKTTENALLESEVDPRLLLLLVPKLSSEVAQGSRGIWVPNGLNILLNRLWWILDLPLELDTEKITGENLLQLLKRYLLDWRRKKGSPSISDEKEVFQTVDAALLHVLLVLDSKTPLGPAKRGSVRAELNSVVDNGVDCFGRAIELLEHYKRLYIMSRLYQCRKMSGQVLATWRRIVEGEDDKGGEFLDGESEVRRYLAKINDKNLVEEYGSWLASRNPKLGVLVFSETNSKIRLTPERAVEVLKQRAPNAVKDFLERLVFGNNLAEYANDLISYYLDSVLSELSRSNTARSVLLQSYEAYRSLHNPKPTYTQFAADGEYETEWWANRLRLLQLLGGSHEAASKYDIISVSDRIETYKNELIPEMVILYGRQGRHSQAINLLTHGLRDYDTAIRYCMLGGVSTYSFLKESSTNDMLPARTDQRILFAQLLEEFLAIEDPIERITQTSRLLERFAAWFDIMQVLPLIPDSWSVEALSAFLENAFRDIIAERNETSITRALTGNDNLVINFDHIKRIDVANAKANGIG